ncbi:winged helix-turn-helix domain-containing protein [Pseudoxanthomonas gei]|nr:winged helix-turn-helix domain-containing protein [Pseudoxanthomonas gei]
MPSSDTPALAFDDFVIDFAGRRLLRGGQALALEPKAFSVLALLAQGPGQAFTRDEILDAVWGHRHVTPGVLNRIMTLLRHALGEEAQAPRYLHTLHGVGYRFDLPAPHLPGASAEASVEERRHAAERRTSMSPTVPATTSRRGWWPRAALVLVLVVALLGTGVWFKRQVWVARPAPPSPAGAVATPTLIVMPLKPIGGRADGDIAAGLSDELISALARIQGLRVIARESTSLATVQPAEVATLVSRLGISHTLEGSLRQSGEQLRIHLRLNDARNGRTLWTQDYDRNANDVLALQREVAQAVATALTLKLGLAKVPAQKGGDAGFLRRYFAAQALLRTPASAAGEAVERAETEFRQLVQLRPYDARAHAGLAVALDMRAFSRPPLAAGLRAEAAQEAALAQRLDPSLADPYRVQASAACRGNRWEDCVRLFEQAGAAAPSDSQPYFQYAMALAALGYLDRAEALMRHNIERDPLNPSWRFGHGRLLDTLGRHEQARAQLELGRPFAPYARWFNAVWRKDYAQAAAIADKLGDSVDSPAYERLYKPSYVAATGALRDPSLWPQVETELRASERETGLMNFLRVLAPEAPAHAPALIAGLDQVRERSYSSWDLLLWTRDLAYLRKDPAFQDYLRDNGLLAYWKRHGFPKQCRPHADGAACD